MTIDTGTTVVLPNPADAPAPPKAKGRRRPSPRSREAEVADWAKRAAARDTAAEMAAGPEAAPVRRARPRRRRGAPEGQGQAGREGDAHRHARIAPRDRRRLARLAPRRGPHALDGFVLRQRPRDRLRPPRRDTAAATITEKQIAGFNASEGVMKKAQRQGEGPARRS